MSVPAGHHLRLSPGEAQRPAVDDGDARRVAVAASPADVHHDKVFVGCSEVVRTFPDTEAAVRICGEREAAGLLGLDDFAYELRRGHIFLAHCIDDIDIEYQVPGVFEALDIVRGGFGSHRCVVMVRRPLLLVPFDMFQCRPFFPKGIEVRARLAVVVRGGHLLAVLQ